jgi:ATP-dependent helicase/nuclease subunit B
MYEPLLEVLESGATVVTANNRLARSLERAYGRRQQSAGKQAWKSPAVFSWNNWLTRLWEQSQMTGGQASHLHRISETDASVLWEDIALTDQGDTASGAALANRAWKLLCDWQAVAAPEWSESGLSIDQQIFLRWLGQYRDRLSKENWRDTAQFSEELLVDVNSGLFDDSGELVFAGFDVWSPARITFREAIAKRGVSVSIAADGKVSGASAKRLSSVSDRAELVSAARWARAQVEANPALEVCVVVSDLDARASEVRRVFMNVFCPDWRSREARALPVNFSYGNTLAEQPRIAAALNLLWLAQGDVDYRRFSLALRSPFLRAGREEADKRAQLDLRLRDKLGAAITLKDALGFAGAHTPELAGVFEYLVETEAAGKKTLAEWADWITTTLEKVGWPGDDSLDSLAYQELESWYQLLREFAASARMRDSISLSGALGLLERLSAARLHQPETGAGVVQVIGMLEAAGHEFDRLWVTGLAAEDWPPPANLNPLLPFGLQRRCGMPGSSPSQELDYAEKLTHRLRHSSPETIFSWSAVRDGEALHPSGLILELVETTSIQLWSEPSWAEAMFASATVSLLDEDMPLPWQPGKKARGGSSLFGMQASCPLRAFLELRLGAGEVEDPVTGISYKARGSLAHNVLEDFYKRHRNSAAICALDDTALADELNELTAKHIRGLPGLRRPFMRTVAELETQRLMPLLVAFVKLDQSREDFTVVGVEQDDPHVTVGPLTLWLKLDRLDELGTGGRVVIDYKTGKVARKDWNPARPGNMQLPLYATFTSDNVDGVAFAQVSTHGVKYDGVASDSVAIEGVISAQKLHASFRGSDGESIKEWDVLIQAWQECLLALADDFAAGNCSINPKHADDAKGQMAVLTRVFDLPATGLDEEGGNGQN